MGIIRIELQGSFGPLRRKSFSAMKHGHAQAVADAIEYLCSVEMPKAIRLDHQLQSEGHKPDGPFGKDQGG